MRRCAKNQDDLFGSIIMERTRVWVVLCGGVLLCLMAAGCGQEQREVEGPALTEEQVVQAPVEEAVVEQAVEEAQQMIAEEQAAEEVEQSQEPVAEEKADEAQEVVALNFEAGDSNVYKATTLVEDGVQFKGDWPENGDYSDKRNMDQVEMTFEQKVESIDEQGNATLRITIEGLRYTAVHKNRPILDFNSKRAGDKEKPLYKLLGQGYTIKLSPLGEVLEVSDTEEIVKAIEGATLEHRKGQGLLGEDVIKQRHGFYELSGEQAQESAEWTGMESFSFGIMGAETFEKMYEVKEISDQDVVKVEIEGIPASGTEEDLTANSPTALSEMSDNQKQYFGQMYFDLESGKIIECVEKLISNWLITDPEGPEEGNEPAALQMSSIRVNRLDKLD